MIHLSERTILHEIKATTHLPRGDLAPRLRLFDRDGDDVADAPALAALVDALRDFCPGVVRDLELRPVADHQSGGGRKEGRQRRETGASLSSQQERRRRGKVNFFFFSARGTKRKNETKN